MLTPKSNPGRQKLATLATVTAFKTFREKKMCFLQRQPVVFLVKLILIERKHFFRAMISFIIPYRGEKSQDLF